MKLNKRTERKQKPERGIPFEIAELPDGPEMSKEYGRGTCAIVWLKKEHRWQWVQHITKFPVFQNHHVGFLN